MTTTSRAARSVFVRCLSLLIIGLAASPAFALSVTVTAPANGAVFAPGSAITISATATPTRSNRPITKVEFFRTELIPIGDGIVLVGDTFPIGTDTTAPYSIIWSNVPSGFFTLTAKATDSSGATASSSFVAPTVRINTLPSVSLTAPASGAVFAAGSTISLAASASDTDGTIAQVQFFSGSTLLGTATTAPYSFAWTNVASGTYSLTARATDNDGGVTASTAVSITVNAPPTVSITGPAQNAVFTAPANIAVTATAADTDGTITKVDFFQGATLVGTATAAPYSVTLSNAALGTHTLTARATDNLGLTTTSAAVSVVVNAAPSVSISSPANNAVFVAPANITVTATAADTDGTIAKVDFFDGATLIGTATAAPYSVTLANAAAGSRTLTAQATDDRGGTTTSTAVTVRVDAGPTVSITSPADNSVFAAPATVTLTANAADSDGTITKVDFFQGATLVGTATAAPYTTTLSGLASGAYSFTAVATDNDGATTTSIAVNVVVNSLPAVSITTPGSGASFPSPANIPITVSASDTDGTINRVEVYASGSLITTLTAAPYSFTWTNVPTGTYALSAKAFDNNNGLTSSAEVTITVQQRAAALYFIHADHLNTPRLIADSTGTAVWRWDQQEPFGVSPADENPSGLGVFKFALRHSGQYDDPETGMFYNYLRDCYDPATGRFCQPDLIGTVLFEDMAFRRLGSIGFVQPQLEDHLYTEKPRYNHLYSYVNNSPLLNSDFFGLCPPYQQKTPTVPCPGVGGQTCGARTIPGGLNPLYPNVCTQCLNRIGAWPFGGPRPPGL